MATRTLTLPEWLRLVRRHATDDGFANVSGFPVIDAADRLGVSKQRVHQLLEAGVLDSLAIVNKRGTVAVMLVTEASVNRYLAKRIPDVRGRQGFFSFPETA